MRWIGFAGVVVLVGVTLLNWAARVPEWAQSVVFGAGIAGMGLLVLAWGLLGREILRADGLPHAADSALPRRAGARQLRWLRARIGASPTSREPLDASWLNRTLALWVAPLLATPPLFSGDVYSYLAQGEIAARGLDPYHFGPSQGLGAASAVVQRVSVLWRDTPSPYGPLFTLIQRGIAGVVGENPVLGVLACRALAVAGLLLVVWALPRLAALTGVPASRALWLGALNPLVLWHFVAGVHNDSLMIGLMLAGTVLALGALTTEKLDVAGLTAGVLVIMLGAEVKLPALVALAVVGVALVKRHRGGLPRLAVVAVVMAAAFAVVSIVVSYLGGAGLGWTHTLGTSSAVNSWMAPTNWFGFLVGGCGAVFGVHVVQPMIGVGRIIGYVFALAGVGYLVRRQLTTRTTAVAALGGLMAVIVVFGPVVQPWYLLWATIPLAACLRDGRPIAAVAGFTALFAVVLPPLGTHNVVLLILGYALGLTVLAAAAYRLTRAAHDRTLAGATAGRDTDAAR